MQKRWVELMRTDSVNVDSDAESNTAEQGGWKNDTKAERRLPSRLSSNNFDELMIAPFLSSNDGLVTRTQFEYTS